jgi:uncharacterized membrane protein
MQSVWRFFKITLMGGLLFLVPFIVLTLVLGKAFGMIQGIVEPLSKTLALEDAFGGSGVIMLGLALLMVICFCAGMLAQTAAASRLVDLLEGAVLSKVPGYSILKDASENLIDTNIESKHSTVLVRLDDAWQFGLKMESIGNGDLVTVFIPDSPTPQSGSVLIVAADRVRNTDIPIGTTITCLRNRGIGFGAVLSKLDN